MTDVTRRLFLALIMYFAADFAVPLEPGPGRFVIEDMEEAVAAPRRSARVRVVHATAAPPLSRQTFRFSAPPQPLLTHRPQPQRGKLWRSYPLEPPGCRLTVRTPACS